MNSPKSLKLKGLSQKDLAILIAGHLARKGIDVVLTGGACVAIHTNHKYVSADLDFVLISDDKQKETKEFLLSIGFYEEGRFFRHKDTDYFLDFISPPLSIGDEPPKELIKIAKKGLVLKLLSPTDCTKDRLAAYYYWDDRQALEQAILVSFSRPIDLNEVKRWSEKEGMAAKYSKFLKARHRLRK